ncbi:MAG: glycoside hydrolase family 13 protein [Bifidobacterium sp.]|nr:glycoside hydrolase family 13 protein [Bifidobacterium sp.]
MTLYDATDTTGRGAHRPWWMQAAVYQVYPRSFADTTGNGVGDLNGIRSRLPYLLELGIDAIWITPFYPSQLADGGYDVDDQRAVDPRMGTIDDFDRLARDAHARGIRVIVDIVPNHTSDRHRWFRQALAAPRDSEARDRYIFRDGRGTHGELPPTDWTASFGAPAWTRVDDGQWYLHMFTPQQPDLNWNNPDVRADYLETLRFWMRHGADGFRVDVAHGLAKDLDRPDLNDYDVHVDGELPADGSHPLYDRDDVHAIYRQWRTVLNEADPPAFAVAEAWVNPQRQHLYASPDELRQVFNFEFAKANWTYHDLSDAIQAGLDAAETSRSSTTWVMSNHDVIRHATRYALPQVDSPQHHQLAKDWLLHDGHAYHEDRPLGQRRARAAILMELALPGSAYLYQGEELGLPEVADIPRDHLEDPTANTSTGAYSEKGRDGCRVPLPWRAAAHDNDTTSHGFSPRRQANGQDSAPAHLPQPEWYAYYAVDCQDQEPNSILNLYRTALHLRHRLTPDDLTLRWHTMNGPDGQPDGANGHEGGIIAFTRSNGWASVTNLSARPIPLPKGQLLLTSAPLTAEGLLPTDTTAWIQTH